ncbi:MAG: ribbon-helix-helix domain-containing protein [Actinobacteria bacterium]|nr:ribbon-helix-helix domain-containing protein [Actinomycetota bacterium]MBU4358739.1 ribbon-helix-helix domain-containing protein [Actinomycetota bacterium]MBU4441655.1 ribbon-helix-helix domain-containing protein [Actinomycetota bacterium]
MSSNISIRVPESLLSELDELASLLGRSRSSLINEAIESYLTEYNDYLLALHRLLDKDDDIISSSELRESLGI